jgi:hypothetical protein
MFLLKSDFRAASEPGATPAANAARIYSVGNKLRAWLRIATAHKRAT